MLCWRAVALGILSTDPAKYALNLPVPHPPLGRWVMLVSQAVFGSGILAIRLPTLVADVLAMLLVFRLIQKRSSDAVVVLVALIAMFAASLLWLGSGFQTSFLALGIALIATGVVGEPRPKLAWVVLGYALALWTQVQGVLLLLFVGVVLWNAWDQAQTKTDRQTVAAAGGFVLLQTGLLALWLLSNPFALADALDLAGRAPAQEWQRVVAFARSELSRVWGVLVLVVMAALGRTNRTWLTYAYVFTVVLFTLYIYKNPAPYYLSYVVALLMFGVALTKWSPRRLAMVMIGAVALIFIDYRMLAGQFAWRSQRTNMEIEELRRIASSSGVVTVGDYGYDWNYLIGQRFVRLGSDAERFASATTAIVFLPDTVNETERGYLERFTSTTRIGSVTVYAR